MLDFYDDFKVNEAFERFEGEEYLIFEFIKWFLTSESELNIDQFITDWIVELDNREGITNEEWKLFREKVISRLDRIKANLLSD